MRVISGRFRGRRLARIIGDIRPTSDRLRESLFNVLGEEVFDSVWLDPFCGSGAVGIEALSRGARFVLFNDRDPVALQILKKNLEICRIEEGFKIRNLDAFTLLRKLETPTLDFVFLDPPYRFERHAKFLDRLFGLPQVFDRTLVLIELFHKKRVDFLPPHVEIVRTLREGDSRLHFLRFVKSNQGS